MEWLHFFHFLTPNVKQDSNVINNGTVPQCNRSVLIDGQLDHGAVELRFDGRRRYLKKVGLLIKIQTIICEIIGKKKEKNLSYKPFYGNNPFHMSIS